MRTKASVSHGLMIRAGDRFLRGPVQLDWLSQASAQSGKALHVAVALAYQAGLESSLVIRFGSKLRRLFSLDRHSLKRGLTQLEGSGLVGVQQVRGRVPVVTIRLVDNQEAKPTSEEFCLGAAGDASC